MYRVFWSALALTAVLMAPAAPAAADDLIPARRSLLSEGFDLPGHDLRNIFNVTLEACEKACLADTACEAFTWNSRNGACFPKTGGARMTPFAGAISGVVIAREAALAARAEARVQALPFLRPAQWAEASEQAQGLSKKHLSQGLDAATLREQARVSETQGDLRRAWELRGAVTALTDSAADWADYARLSRSLRTIDNDFPRAAVISPALNAWLRSPDDPATRHSLLVNLAQSFETLKSGTNALKVLHLAQSLTPRDDTARDIARLDEQYGMRILGHQIQSDRISPRICAEFSENLIEKGFDYAPFVQAATPGLVVEPGEWRELCVSGLPHGARAEVTFRAGLPSASGLVTSKSVTLSGYVRDRNPAVTFPGRGYVLARGAEPYLPVTSVNTTALDLTLYALSDRNLLRSLQQDWFGEQLDDWNRNRFARDAGEEIWKGRADVAMEPNRDVPSRLPLQEALAGRAPGIYALRAQAPGKTEDYENPPAWAWFVLTDLGISSWSGSDGVTVAVRALADATPKSGVTVDLLTRSNRVLASLTADAEGVVHFGADLTAGTGAAAPAMVMVRDGVQDFAFLSLSEPEFDLSDRGVAGREAAGAMDVWITTERGAYRAGETVHATILARNGEARAIADLPLTARLRRPDGVEHSRSRITDQAGGFVYQAALGPNPPRGSWKLEVLADPEAAPLATHSFLVEDFLPERIDFTLTAAEGPVDPDQGLSVALEGRYLFGAKGAELDGGADLFVRETSEIASLPGYHVGLAGDELRSDFLSDIAVFTTDAEGRATFDAAIPTEMLRNRPLELSLRVRLSEGSGRPVERRLTRQVTLPAALPGIRPKFDGPLAEGAEAGFDLIASQGQIAAEWRLERLETRYQWYRLDGEWSWEPVISRTKIDSGALPLSDQPQSLSLPTTWGEYELTVQARDGSAASSYRFASGWFAPADTSRSPDFLELSLDRPAYRAGETAQLRLVPRSDGVALISVMSNRLISLTSVAVTAGENLVSLPVTEEWGAGVYVSASVLREGGAADRQPARAMGIAHAQIDPGDRKLSLTLDLPAEASPRGTLPVALSVRGGKPGERAFVTIAAVDVGILNLTGFAAPAPEAHYFGQRRLGVGLRDLYGRLIAPGGGATAAVRSGGDGLSARLQAKPPTEELVAWFSGPLEVGADGRVDTSFELPAFNGTVKVMAIAWSQSALGATSGDVLVRDPVVVSASLPRFMQPGDESRLRLDVIHAFGPTGRVSLDATASGVTLGPVPSGLDLSEGARATAQIALSVAPDATEQTATLDLRLSTADGKLLPRPLNLPILSNDPTGQLLTQIELAPGQSLTLDQALFAGFRPGTGYGLISSGALARYDAPGLLAALDSYPWGCTEQLTSRLMPLLYFAQMADVMGLKDGTSAQERIRQTIAAILLHQTNEGGFGLWSAGDEGEFWLDAYVTDALSRARSLGHAVPDVAFRAALDNLRSQANYTSDFDKGGEALAYALMVLAREGAAAIGDLRYYADVKAGAFATPLSLAHLGAALALYGDQPRADSLFARASRMALAQEPAAREQIWRADFGTPLRDLAGVVALAREAGSTAIDLPALSARLTARAGRQILSTQEQAFLLLAAAGPGDLGGAAQLSLDGQSVPGPLLHRFEPAAGPVTVQNTSAAPAMLSIATFGQLSGAGKAESHGYQITRRYYDLNGEPAGIDQIRTGTRLVAVLEVTPTGRGEARLIVTDPLPAGFEIDNPNLMRSGQIEALSWLETESNIRHAEFREDRFMAALDRQDQSPFRLAYILRAVSPGDFHHAPASVEDMYRPTFRAHSDSGRVIVTE